MSSETIAITRYGRIQGEAVGKIMRFAGVPFADRIDGRCRFRRPMPPPPWTGIRKTTQWAPPVPQIKDAAESNDAEYFHFMFGSSFLTPMSEEGLFLNLWTPTLGRDAKLPVMVWLHGGAFATGSPTRPREDGSSLALNGPCVVVAPNHRLGALGYLYLEELVPEYAGAANVGMLDIIACLEWIAENIENFGGDPGNVTVFGESGGAFKTATLIAMPKAQGLFHRAVCQSGAYASGFCTALSRAEASELSKRFLRQLAVERQPEKLADLPVERILAAEEDLRLDAMGWRPVADGNILPQSPEKAVEDRCAITVPLLLGTSLYESDVLAKYGGQMSAHTPEELVPLIGERVRVLADRYRSARNETRPQEIVRAILSDWFFRIPSILFAESYVAAGGTVFMYLFVWQNPNMPETRPTHGGEAPFIFGTLDSTGWTRDTPSAEDVSRTIQNAWLSFARNGDPNHAGIPNWPTYSPGRRATMILDQPFRVDEDPYRRERAAWREVT